MDLATLANLVTIHPSLQSIPFDRLLWLIASAAALKNDILLMQPSDHPALTPPLVLPDSVQVFFLEACDLPISTIVRCWSAFKDIIWHCADVTSLLAPPPSVFLGHGLIQGFSSQTLYPPSQYCPAPSCPRTLKGMRMMHAEQRTCVLYTLSSGPLLVYSVHLSCEACEINYHHNFKVFKGDRTYYGGIPDVMQVGEHQFVERRVVEMWMSLMDHWTSATSCADFYNTALGNTNEPPANWAFGFSLSSDHVWSAFLLYSLLEDATKRHEHLVVKHTGDQKDRFTDLIRAHNEQMRINGQPEVTHFCNKCTRWFHPQDGKAKSKCSVVVTDGVCIGHPCCGVHNCKVPLQNNRDRFCSNHSHLEAVCAIVGCDQQVVSGQLTCADPVRQRVESHHKDKGLSRFQLRDRLQRAHDAHPSSHSANSRILSQLTALDDEEDVFDVNQTGRVTQADSESTLTATAKTKLRAKFTRARTHNEQLAVAPCGIILGRDTMFGAEGVASVAEFIKCTFRMQEIKPDHLFFDNNCSLAQHVRSDLYFATMGLSVDVFHFKSKHKETHVFCQQHCNPAAFPELISEDGQGWFFNSSVAEQTNVWIGGYHAMCREMLVDKYDFFLDQMILRRNRATKAKLVTKGAHPSNWSI